MQTYQTAWLWVGGVVTAGEPCEGGITARRDGCQMRSVQEEGALLPGLSCVLVVCFPGLHLLGAPGGGDGQEVRWVDQLLHDDSTTRPGRRTD